MATSSEPRRLQPSSEPGRVPGRVQPSSEPGHRHWRSRSREHRGKSLSRRSCLLHGRCSSHPRGQRSSRHCGHRPQGKNPIKSVPTRFFPNIAQETTGDSSKVS